jgi:hypothetical protein
MSEPDLEFTRLIETIAEKLARIEHRPLADAKVSVLLMLQEARQHYRGDGAPYGDRLAGFLEWWFERF